MTHGNWILRIREVSCFFKILETSCLAVFPSSMSRLMILKLLSYKKQQPSDTVHVHNICILTATDTHTEFNEFSLSSVYLT